MMLYKLFLKAQKIKFDKKLKLKGVPIIVNKGSLEIGESVTIKSSILSNLIGIYQRTIICVRTSKAKIKIGNHVGMSGVTIYAREKIEIGDYTLLGANVKIMDNDFHPLDVEERLKERKEKIKTKPVIIGKNCFIGCNAILLKGTILGDNCIVGAGAVVSGVFEDNSLIVGNPGKVIRKM